jgi:dihydroorotate dehydrogenase (fumarate)
VQTLATTYMGIALNSPVIVGSCSLSKQIGNIKAAEEAGAGALVIKSLFEEQLQIEAMHMEEELQQYQEMIDEAMSFHPQMEHGGPSEHLMWLEKAREAVSIPLIASLNVVSPGEWANYAVQLERTGIDGLELNLYSVITDLNVSGHDVLQAMLATLADVKAKVKIPVAVKLSPHFASIGNAVHAFETAAQYRYRFRKTQS